MVQSNRPAPSDLLPAAIEAVRQARSLIRKEFHRPGGPRGEKNKAPIDEEVEEFLRRQVLCAISMQLDRRGNGRADWEIRRRLDRRPE